MTTKQYLTQALVLNRKINTKLAELDNLKAVKDNVKSISSGEKVQSSHENNSNKNIDKIIDLEREINADIDKLIEFKKNIKATINMLENDKYKIVLINRYVNCLSFEKCAIVLNYSTQHTFRLHNQAIKFLKKSINVIE